MTATTSGPTFKNRQGWLIFFGVGLVILGLLALGMAALVTFTALVGSSAQVPAPMPVRVMLPVTLIYVGIGALFIVLGVGSAMSRRWAQALTLAFSWMWLITGIFSVIIFILTVNQSLDALPPEQAAMKPFIVGCMAIMFGFFFIAVPLTLVLFYRGANVRATVEAFDPVRRWTDGVPIPLLAFVLWMLLGCVGLLLTSLMFRALPVGPWVVEGLAVFALILAFAAVLLFIGIGSLKRMKAAWWTALALFTSGVVYSAIFLAKPNVTLWYDAMDIPVDPRQLEIMEEMYSGPFFLIAMGILWVAYFGFLFYLRRYFFGQRTIS